MLNRSFLVGCGVGGGDAHRYWRLYFTGDTAAGETPVYIGEIELREEVGGADITSPSTTCGSSQADAGPYTKANSIDNNTGTLWASGAPATGHWLSYTFPEAVVVKEVGWYPGLTGPNYAPTSFELQFSDDGSSWTALQSWAPSWSGSYVWQFFEV